MTELLNAAEAAAILRCSPKSIYAMAAAGQLRAVRVSPKILRFRSEDVEALIAASLTTGGLS